MIGKLGKEVKALKKILIVEDDQLLNRTLAYNLTSDGYEVISVFNFDSAVRKLRENEFDVALLEILTSPMAADWICVKKSGIVVSIPISSLSQPMIRRAICSRAMKSAARIM